MKIPKDRSILLDIQYTKPNYRTKEPDFLHIIWRDLMTGEKHLSSIKEPKIPLWFTKPECRNHSNNKVYEKIENLDMRIVKYNSVINEIAKDIGPKGKDYLQKIYSSRDFSKLNDFLFYPYVYAADYTPISYYRREWLDRMDPPSSRHVTKGFLDIETLSLGKKGMSDPRYNEIDLVTLVDNDSKISYTFCLTELQYKEKDTTFMSERSKAEEEKIRQMYESRRQQEIDFMENIEDFKKELHEAFDDVYGELEYKFFFYTNEAKMLVHLFQLIHKLKTDFILIWNFTFDIPYIMDRLTALGLDPKDVMCHPDFQSKSCYFKFDNYNKMIKNKGDYFYCSSYTNWICQMRLYAAIRKSQKEKRSLRLGDVGFDEIGDSKLDYSEEKNFKEFPFKNYKKYVMYNIKDVLLQMGIERRTSDVDTLWVYSYKNATPYQDVFKQIAKHRNLQYIYYKKQGLIPQNNLNKLKLYSNDKDNRAMSELEKQFDDDEDEDSFDGALVGNPKLIDKFGAEIYGSPSSSVFNFSIDEDMGAFYPSTIISHQIFITCLYFKAECSGKQFKPRGGEYTYTGITDRELVKENDSLFDGDIAKEIFDNFQTRNWISIGHKWMNLPSIEDIVEEYNKG